MFRQRCQDNTTGYKIGGYCAIALVIICSHGGHFQTSAASLTLPFHTGEELTFKVSWLGIGVGIATMKVEPHLDQTTPSQPIPEMWRLSSQARTFPFFDRFHKVDDHAESLFNPHTRLPHHFYIRQHEGQRRDRYEMTFNQSQNHVAYHRRDDPVRIIPTETGVQDPLSILYTVRTLDLPVGESLSVPIFNKGKTWVTEVRILKREPLDLPMGTINTIKIQPLLRDAGIFHHQGHMFIWLTDDAHRVPVQLQSNIKIGSIKARLIDAKGVQLTRVAASHSGPNTPSEMARLSLRPTSNSPSP